MSPTSTLTRARTWVVLAVGVLAILGTLFGLINGHTRDKLETVGMRIGAIEGDVREYGAEIIRNRGEFRETRERLVRIETHQETMSEKQDRILDAIERLRDE